MTVFAVSPTTTFPAAQWDIFCQVIDNWGDMGVCWRLARQLANEHQATVRLWLDDWERFRPLYPALGRAQPTVLPSTQGHLSVWPWASCQTAHWDETVASVVVEGFGCHLPTPYLQALQKKPSTRWLVMEYLSAETWVESVHGLASPHPQSGLMRYFFYPGFTQQTGGLLREMDLHQRLNNPAHLVDFCTRYHLPPRDQVCGISLFAYPHAPLAPLLDAWVNNPTPIWVAVPNSAITAPIHAWCGTTSMPATLWQRGSLTLQHLPMLPHEDYDCLLAWAHLNFVRGEDSFVRAQWAARPMIWHIYPQAEQAHEEKLAAWLQRYTTYLAKPSAQVLYQAHQSWNQGQALDWSSLQAQLSTWQSASQAWCTHQAHYPDFAQQLVEFCQTAPNG